MPPEEVQAELGSPPSHEKERIESAPQAREDSVGTDGPSSSTTTIAIQAATTTVHPAFLSPQKMFFSIPELVTEVVGYLSVRQDVVNCLYISKCFYNAAVPLVYKFIPLEQLDNVDPDLKERYLRTVITLYPKRFGDSSLKPALPHNILYERDYSEEDLSVYYEWSCVTGTENHTVLYLAAPSPPETLWLFNSVFGATRVPVDPPPAETPEGTMTLVCVPPFISGETGGASFENQIDLYEQAWTALDFPDRKVTIVGMEFIDPFDYKSWSEGSKRFIDAHIQFWYYLDNRLAQASWTYDPQLSPIYRDRLKARTQFLTLFEYLNTTRDWRNVLDPIRVGKWMNKYRERRQAEIDKAVLEAARVWHTECNWDAVVQRLEKYALVSPEALSFFKVLLESMTDREESFWLGVNDRLKKIYEQEAEEKTDFETQPVTRPPEPFPNDPTKSRSMEHLPQVNTWRGSKKQANTIKTVENENRNN